MEALAHAWESGWNAASERAQRILLLAGIVGVRRAEEQIKAEGPAPNPYRVPR